MTAPLAYFGITSNGVNLAINLVILFLVIMWLSLLYWTFADARRRIDDRLLIGCAVVASLFPFVGTLVYMILRPPEYLEDVRERELEMQAAEARLHSIDVQLCPHCDHHVDRDMVRCPHCLRKIKERCVNCARPLDIAWSLCPYCETEVPGATPPRRPRRRREAGAEGGEPTRRRETAPDTGFAEPRRRESAPETAFGEPRRREPPPERVSEPRRREPPPERAADPRLAPESAAMMPPGRGHTPGAPG